MNLFVCGTRHPSARRRSVYWLICLVCFALLETLLMADGPVPSNTVVRFEFWRGTNQMGSADVELFDQEKPETVRNFLLYVRSGAYSNSFLHRCVPGFVVQGGGFYVTNPTSASTFSTYFAVTNHGRLPNEFSSGTPYANTLGTLAMAKIGGDPDSATSQWYFNMADNSTNLDSQNGGFTVFGRMLATTNANDGTNVLEQFNRLSTSAGIVNLNSLLGTNYQAFTSLPVTYTNTVSRVPLYRELYYVSISVLDDLIPPGTVPPSITLTSPPPYSLFTNQPVTVAGTAADDVGIARVVYRLGNGPWSGAFGTTNWEVTVDPALGFNTVTVRSIDWDGNYSPEASQSFHAQRTVPLELGITGDGTVAGVTNGQPLNVGASYTVTATPLAGKFFDGWTGSITSLAPTVTFQVATNATNYVLNAKFIPDPLPSLTGTYHGLFQTLGNPDWEGTAFMILSLSASGYISGSIQYHGVDYYYTGQFDSGGNASLTGPMEGVNRTISLTLQKSNPQGLITGTFSGTSSTTLVQLERLDTTLPPTNTPAAGKYTFVIPAGTNAPSASLPGGSGYGTGNLASSGTFTLTGTLGDGTAFSASPMITRLGRWPLYVPLDSGRGALWGWITYSSNQLERVQSTLSWIRTPNGAAPTYPGGFTNQVPFAAAFYTPPLPGQRVLNWAYGQLRLTGTDLYPNLTNTLYLSTNNTFQALDPNLGSVQLSLDGASGLINGSFVHPWFGTTNLLHGAVLGTSNYIRGQYAINSQISGLSVDASPIMVTQSVASVTLPALLAAMNDGGVLLFQGDGEIVLTNALSPQFDTRLEANGHSVVISGGHNTRLVVVPTNLTFSASGMTFANGLHQGADGANGAVPTSGADGYGGGFLNLGGTLALTNCLITNCVATGGEAGLDSSTNDLPTMGGRGLGAAFCNLAGTLLLENCTIGQNLASGGGNRSLSASNSISDNAATAVGAGLFLAGGKGTLLDCTFVDNRAVGGLPLTLAGGGTGRAGDAAGGAIGVRGGILQLTNTLVLSNVATGPNEPASGGSGHGYGGGLFLETNTSAVVIQARFVSNAAVAGSFDQASEAPNAKGGAVFNAGSLNLRDCSFEQNSAAAGSSIPAGEAWGGAVASAGLLIINSSTFSENVALGGEYLGTPASAVNGGRGAGGAVYSLANTWVTNSTFAYNHATGGSGADPAGQTNAMRGSGRGGALLVASNATVLINVTAAFNQASAGLVGQPGAGDGDGGGLAREDGTLDLRNSLVASNTPANFAGSLIDSGYNLSSDDSFMLTSSGSHTNTDPALLGLSTNGGPTATMAILSQSPARDAVPANYPALDQRGTSRPQGSFADIGAFEYVQTLPLFAIQPSGTNTARLGTNVTFQAFASGPSPIGYFWLKDETPLPGFNSNSLTLTNIQESDAGQYAAVATNSYGATTSSIVTLVVDLRPVITLQPQDLVISPGATTSLVVTALGPSLGYVWYHNQVIDSGSTGASLNIVNAQPGDDGTYQLIITNTAGAVTSRVAAVSWSSSALAILAQPQSTVVAIGDSPSLNVLASGVGLITYQWFKNGVLLPGQTNLDLTFNSVTRTDGGSYSASVANAFTTLVSTSAVLTVVAPPSLAIAFPNPLTIEVTCFGDPGRVHRLLSSSNLNLNASWSTVTSAIIPGSGQVTWSLPFSTNSGPLFFRAVTP